MYQNKYHYRLALAGQIFHLILSYEICDIYTTEKFSSLIAQPSDDELTFEIINYTPGDLLPADTVSYEINRFYRTDGSKNYTCYFPFVNTESVELMSVINMMPLKELLLQRDSVLLHAATIACDGSKGKKSIAFTAKSETGKSTQAYLWRAEFGANVICEDRTVISVTPDGCTASTYPLDTHRKDYIYSCEKLGAIVVLEQGKTNRIVRLTAADAVKHIYFLILTNTRSSEDAARVLDVLLRITQSIPVYLLTCCIGKEPAYMLRTKLTEDGVL